MAGTDKNYLRDKLELSPTVSHKCYFCSVPPFVS
uniref:Uncharacterized protein n=1 Tax=Heterorhabditis bacteriophora TaxID=37862 RepID=A0A1I7X542_HETBA